MTENYTLNNVVCVCVCASRLLTELSEVAKSFSKFWLQHERRLDQCLQLRRFEEKFKNVSSHLFR